MKIRNLILLAFGLLPFFAASQTATFDRVRVRQGLTIRAEKADSIIRAVTALSNHTSIPTAKAVWDAIAAIVAASKYQTLRDDGSNMTQQPAANFVSTGTVAFTLTNDGGNTETEIAAAVPAGGITSTELAASSVNSSKIRDTTIVAGDIKNATITSAKLANSGVSAGSYPSTNTLVAVMTINAQGQVTAVSQIAAADGSNSNEGILGVAGNGSNDAALTTNTSTGSSVVFAGGTGIAVTESTSTNGGTITISAVGGSSPDSTWAKSPSGTYSGKRITDNIYHAGKAGVGTTDTTATFNLKPQNPVGSGHTILSYIVPPNRSAFSNAAFANQSILEKERIDLNPMRPAHYSGFLYGRWTDRFTIDSTTNLWAGRPGNAIRNTGFNLDGENPALAKYSHSREQHYLPPGSNAALWEDHLEITDTLGRNTRVYQFSGQHNGDSYGAGFAANDFHIDKPHNSGYLLRIRGDGSNTGEWSTDYPYTFQINNATRIGRLMERLHGGSYRNVLDWTTNGRLDVGDSSGVAIQNRLQITRVNADQPEIISPEGYIVFDSTRLEVNSTDGNNRHIVIKRPGTSHTWGLNYSSTNFSFEADYARTPFSIARTAPTTAFTMNSTGRVGLGIPDAYSLIHAQQPADDLTGGLILAPQSGNYFGLYVNGSNEVAFNRGGTNRMYLTDGGQLKLPAYTTTSSFPITAAGVLGFNSAGEIGTVAGITGTGSSTAGQVAVFDGSSSVTGYTSFTRSGSNIIVGASGSDHVEIMPGTSEIRFFDAGNVDARLKASGTVLETNVGMSIGGNSTITGTLDVSGAISTGGHFRAPGVSSGNSGIGTTPTGTFNAFAPNGTSPYITFSEAGVANRGAFGFPTGSAEFLWSVGNQVLSSGTEKMRLGSTGLKVTGTSSAAQLLLNNTTASTGKEWYINSGNAGSLFIGNATTADVITINGTTGATTIQPALTLGTTSGTATSVLGLTSGNVVAGVSLGSGLSLSGGTLSATGSGGSPGGSTTQVQYNNSGSFDGATGLTVDGSENISITQAVSLTGDIAPSNLSGTTNDYAPTSFSTASTLLQTNSAGAIVTGIAAGTDGRWITWHNTGSENLIFRNENALSTAANRLLLGGGDITLRVDGTAGFRYDATASRWRLVYITSFTSGAKVYEFTTGVANYQLDIPAGAKAANITAVGAGGGGGSGRKGASTSARCGGGGGGNGGYYHMVYPLEGSDAATFYVNVGTGGAGGASQTTNNTSGNAGTAGGETDVRVDGTATTNRIFRAGGGNPGNGGTGSGGTGGSSTNVTQLSCNAGGTASTIGGNGGNGSGLNNGVAGSAAAGGGITTANAAGTGGTGGDGAQGLQTGGAANGGDAAAISKNRDSGGGGGGGNGNHTGNATAGGNGVRGGGGGGGGSATNDVGNSGAGGNGGAGYVKIVFFF